jgi:hypothetical protein
LKLKLKGLGLSNQAIRLAWPSWWSEEAESSASAQAELRFVIARRLGLDAVELVENDAPRFVWKVASFKALSTISPSERDTITSFGTSLSTILVGAVPDAPSGVDLDASRLRTSLLKEKVYIDLQDLLSLCWGLGIPVINLKVFPLKTKRMCAMAVRVRDRYAILVAKESTFPSQIAYYVAHELGHIALGHLELSPAIVDLDDPLNSPSDNDPEEEAADQYALRLLTGDSKPRILTEARRFSAASLAKTAQEAGPQLHIEPGLLALCFGHGTKRWDKVFAALKLIYPERRLVSAYINGIAFSQLSPGNLSDDAEEYLRNATSGPEQ